MNPLVAAALPLAKKAAKPLAKKTAKWEYKRAKKRQARRDAAKAAKALALCFSLAMLCGCAQFDRAYIWAYELATGEGKAEEAPAEPAPPANPTPPATSPTVSPCAITNVVVSLDTVTLEGPGIVDGREPIEEVRVVNPATGKVEMRLRGGGHDSTNLDRITFSIFPPRDIRGARLVVYRWDRAGDGYFPCYQHQVSEVSR